MSTSAPGAIKSYYLNFKKLKLNTYIHINIPRYSKTFGEKYIIF
jgi:hypothetical protein